MMFLYIACYFIIYYPITLLIIAWFANFVGVSYIISLITISVLVIFTATEGILL